MAPDDSLEDLPLWLQRRVVPILARCFAEGLRVGVAALRAEADDAGLSLRDRTTVEGLCSRVEQGAADVLAPLVEQPAVKAN